VLYRHIPSLSYTYWYPDSAGIAQSDYNRLVASLSSDVPFVYTKALVNPYIGVGLSGGATETNNVTADSTGSRVLESAWR
jgi:hypothetical protein